MARTRKPLAKRARTPKVDHGVNVGLLLVVILAVLVLGVMTVMMISKKPTTMSTNSDTPVNNYSSTLQLDSTTK